jgi:hypothetical protein
MDENIIKGLEANLDICLRSLDTQKKTLEVSKNYIALLEKLNKEHSDRIIYLEAFTVTLQTKIHKLEGETPSKIEGKILISNNRKDYLVPPGLIPSLGRSITPFHLSH